MRFGTILHKVGIVLTVIMSASAIVTHSAKAEEITFEQVLAAPDDFRLNLTFARQEIAAGRLQQAASALERILLLKPNWDAVRLYYGVVLYRLNDFVGAKRELTLLEGRDLSSAQERDRVRYLALATGKGKSFRVSSRITIGARLDSNPNRASEQAIANAGTNPFTNVGSDSEIGLVGASGTRIEKDIPNGRGDYLFAQSNGFLSDFLESRRADFYSSRLSAGARFHANRASITPYALLGSAGLQYERLQMHYGGGLALSYAISPKVELKADFRAAYEDYKVTSYSPLGSQRDGWNISGSGSISWKATDTQIFGLTGTWSDKNARNDGFSYQRGRIAVNSRTFFTGGRYLALSGGYSRTRFDMADGFYTTAFARNETNYHARAAIGSPIGTLFDGVDTDLPEFIATTVIQVGVSWSNRNSNVNALDVENVSGDILLTKRFQY